MNEAAERKLLFVVAFAQFTHIIDFMIIMPLGSTFMEVFSITPQQFSLMVSVYAFAAFLSGLLGAMYIDRYDRKKALIFVYIGFTIGTFACAIAPGYYFFLTARAIAGLFGGIIGALVLSVVGDAIPIERRGKAMGYVMTAFAVASVAGVPAGIWLADLFGWQMPFIVTGLLALIVIAALLRFMPSMTKHLEESNKTVAPFQVLKNIWEDGNQVKALVFTIVLMLGHFTIIPFIAPYMQLNLGFTNQEVAYIYLFGGICTAVLLPIFGRLSDRYGHARIFTFSSFFALFSIFAITNLYQVSVFIAICVTSSYFIVASGRSVPATTLVTSVVKKESRASFMTIRSSANEMALALSSFIAGFIVTENSDGSLNNYQIVGYIAIFMSIVAVGLSWRLKVVE